LNAAYKQTYKIFCDESNHLPYKDNPTLRSKVMVLGAICAPSEKIEYINRYIKNLRHKHKYKVELKWTKLFSSQKLFYNELLEFFFTNDNMKFQALLVPDKRILKHSDFNQNNPDLFYYKMYYYIFKNLLENEINQYLKMQVRIYLDYKDTRCGDRMKELLNVLHNKFKDAIDFECYTAKSHQSHIIQLVDLLIGAIAYNARDDIGHKSEIKNYIIDKIKEFYKEDLSKNTPLFSRLQDKFNIFRIELGKGK